MRDDAQGFAFGFCISGFFAKEVVQWPRNKYSI